MGYRSISNMIQGHDTTTSGICFTLYLISRHPDVQNKIFAEIQNVFGSKTEKATYRFDYLLVTLPATKFQFSQFHCLDFQKTSRSKVPRTGNQRIVATIPPGPNNRQENRRRTASARWQNCTGQFDIYD